MGAPKVVVVLQEDDIPGAKLQRETPEECKLSQLRRWLLGRGARASGRKSELVKRLVHSRSFDLLTLAPLWFVKLGMVEVFMLSHSKTFL